ncbi:MAG: nucleotidyl transferase AbiEii/AbiGii toxin family protein [Planctomycetaceae bacterium]
MTGPQTELGDYLARITEQLEQAEIKYALCGGLALAIHGHPRFTQDIDLLIEPDNIDQTLEAVKPIGFTIPMQLNTTAGDIEFRRLPAAIETDRVTLDILLVGRDRTLHCVSREGLAHLKRISARPQDQIDLETLSLDNQSDE